VDPHPYAGETIPRAIVVVGNLAKLHESKKKKPRKAEWEIN
jgi:hypothetical protein